MLGSIFIESFSKLEDPRVDRAKKHLLLDIVALTLMATMSGFRTGLFQRQAARN